MIKKSCRGGDAESSRNTDYGFQRGDANSQKKSRRFRRLLKLITGRRQTEWTGATPWSNTDDVSRRGATTPKKKSRRFRRLLKWITGRRQTEWTGATRCPNRDDSSH